MEVALFIVLAIVLGTTALAAHSLAPWVPTWKKDLPRIFRLAQLQQGETFYDLGCGTGTVVFYAARHYPVKAIGIELSLPLWIFCIVRRFLIGRKNATFRFGSLFQQDFYQADVVYVFGMPKRLKKKLLKKLKQELRHGSRVISYVFPIEGLTPTFVDKPKPIDITIYLYRF